MSESRNVDSNDQPPREEFISRRSLRHGAAHPQKSGMSGIFRTIGKGLTAGILLFFIGIGIAAIVVPALTGSTALTVQTGSMKPNLPPGTLVVARPTNIADITPGMVLTYQLKSGESTLVTHRVTQKQQLADGTTVFITQGDANPKPDPNPIIKEQIKGTVWYAIPYVGWLTTLLTGDTRGVLIFVAAGGLLIYAAWMAFSGLRERKARSQTGDNN